MDREPSLYAQLDPGSRAFVARVLASARDYLGARVSFLAEMVGGDKFIRAADGEAEAAGLPVGMRFDLEDSYCYRLLNGRLPEAIYDARTNPISCDIPLTRVLGIESYMGVPVLLTDGSAFGTLCCVNFDPNPEDCARDVAFLRFLGGLLGQQLDGAAHAVQLARQRRVHVESILASGGPTMVFQPIYEVGARRLIGVEALARAEVDGRALPPERLFKEAWDAGCGPDMELAAIRGALWALDCLPRDAYLAVNASAATLALPQLLAMVSRVDAKRLVVELTEHASVADYDALTTALATLRSLGVRVAIDDVGAGYSSLRHVLRIAPDLIKLDIGLIESIDVDLAKQALLTGVMAFATQTHTGVIAEGVETAAQAETLARAGVPHAQGYYFARPGTLAPLIETA
ncbi:sensor domain-containing phosphodiesterase [Lysobacter humi (ex Lee et al. 2017)]